MMNKTGKTFGRNEIADVIHTEVGLSKEDALSVIEDLLGAMTEILNTDKILKIAGFGTFKVVRKKPRMCRNPKTMEKVLVEARDVVSFRPSELWKAKINNRKR